MPPEGAETNLRVVGREPELTEDELRRHRDMQMSARLAEPEPEPEPEPRLDALSPESGQIDPQHRQHEQLELAQAQLAEERGRHDRLMREAEQTRAQLSEQLSSSLADLARARDGTQALLEEMREWNYFKAVVTCQRIVRRRQDARQFRCLLREAVRRQAQLVAQDEGFQVEVREVQKSLVEAERALAVKQQHEDAAQQLQAQSTAELLSMQEDLLAQAEGLKTKLSAAEAEGRLHADSAAQAAIETTALRRQLENALHSSAMSEARGTDELSALQMKLSAAQAEATSNAEAARRASADARSAWSANAELRAQWQQFQAESEAARTELEAELQQVRSLSLSLSPSLSLSFSLSE